MMLVFGWAHRCSISVFVGVGCVIFVIFISNLFSLNSYKQNNLCANLGKYLASVYNSLLALGAVRCGLYIIVVNHVISLFAVGIILCMGGEGGLCFVLFYIVLDDPFPT